MKLQIVDFRLQTEDYCRDIEAYLCQKNDGHLIRVVGPSFDLVSGWAANGIPLKVAFRGIDRHFERYYRKGPRRRPVRIDFCQADVLDVFDEWRRALGLIGEGVERSVVLPDEPGEPDESNEPERDATRPGDASGLDQRGERRRGPSLPAHLERALLRLTQARASGSLGAAFDDVIDRVAHELDRARAGARGLRGEARQALLVRLSALDAELVAQARAALDEPTRASLVQEAEDDLAAFRSTMAPDVFARACDAAVDRSIRERCMIPTLAFHA